MQSIGEKQLGVPQVYCHPAVKKVISLHAALLSVYPENLRIIDVLEQQAEALWTGFREGDDAVILQVGKGLPECMGLEPAYIMKQDLTVHHMRLAVAHDYGYDSWAQMLERGEEVLDLDFENAVDTVLNGNMKKLEEQIQLNPDLVHRRSQFGHGASLLIYLAANGVETWRHVVPDNAPEVMALLIDAGADIGATINVYGGKHSMLELLLCSAHPRLAGVLNEMADLLK